MRVLQLGPYPPPHGGVQSNLVAIRSYLRDKNISCSVINITRHRKAEADEVYYPESAAGLVKLLFHLPFDVLHLHLGGMLTKRLLGLGLVCSSVPGRVSVLTFHSGGYPSTPEGQAAGPRSLAGVVFRRFDGIIGVNQELVNFARKLGVPANRARLIYPHAFLEGGGDAPLLEPFRSFYHEHEIVLVTVGLLEPEYDLMAQLNVLSSVRASHGSVGLVIIGSGRLEPELRRSIQQHPDASHILLCGDVPHTSTLQAIRQARLMLRTTLYDGDAVSVREALYLGTPVIATDNGMRPTGVHLIPKSDLTALRAEIEKQLATVVPRSPVTPQRDDTNLQQTLDFYQQLLARRRSR
jgi:glycogen(starch) synthase